LTIAVRKRMVVPEFATNKSAEVAGMTRASGTGAIVIVGESAFQSGRTSNPSLFRQPIITSVSSLRKAPLIVQDRVLADSAAKTNARFVMLFDPGTFTLPLTG